MAEPRIRIVDYGSLFDEKERENLVPSAQSVQTVWILGYRRTFITRKPIKQFLSPENTDTIASPLIEMLSAHKFNGISFTLPLSDYYDFLNQKGSSYITRVVECDHFLNNYEAYRCTILVPNPHRIGNIIRTEECDIEKYREGAYSISKRFGEVFDKTSYLINGFSLAHYL